MKKSIFFMKINTNFMKKPKIRHYTINNIPALFLETVPYFDIDNFVAFLPIKPKYYKVIGYEIKAGSSYIYKKLEITLEKLQNLKSYESKPEK